jgi:hypothetical protein
VTQLSCGIQRALYFLNLIITQVAEFGQDGLPDHAHGVQQRSMQPLHQWHWQ